MLTTGDVDAFRDTSVRLFGPSFDAVDPIALGDEHRAVVANR